MLSSRPDAIICAHNEEATIGPVVDACINSGSLGRVFVVADKCADNTAAVAGEHGATVLYSIAGDKGSAMKVGLANSTSQRVCLIDADLTGLRPDHISKLCELHRDGMVVGVRGGAINEGRSFSLPGLPPIGGERVVPADLLKSIQLDNAGYELEMRINAAVAHAGEPTHYVWMDGVDQVRGYDKWNFGEALRADAKRWWQVFAGLRHYLAPTQTENQ